MYDIDRIIILEINNELFENVFGFDFSHDFFSDYDTIIDNEDLFAFMKKKHPKALDLLEKGEVDYIVFRSDNW